MECGGSEEAPAVDGCGVDAGQQAIHVIAIGRHLDFQRAEFPCCSGERCKTDSARRGVWRGLRSARSLVGSRRHVDLIRLLLQGCEHVLVGV